MPPLSLPACMITPEKRPALARIELLTFLLFGVIIAIVIIPRLRKTPAHEAPAAQNAPKQPAALP
ncbi:hypothetical protein CMV30_15995 [Nibricoccus aquaticus]|uniref:Uncharacterized protein n=1 Tax=Nibricoccus aquaticus TaxID=2576891 RepID=A0A290QGC7_9BACT|nr:hypothetical protein [Nibricoccus aquaticus]ATC65326.1 hypothetical protein CMV30_15995 [Nibricoccus aquaticus]